MKVKLIFFINICIIYYFAINLSNFIILSYDWWANVTILLLLLSLQLLSFQRNEVK